MVALYIIKRGAIYSASKLKDCQVAPETEFCGIKQINLSIPESIQNEILTAADNVNFGKRVVLTGWKGGRTIATASIIESLPNVWDWYIGLQTQISKEIGATVTNTQDFLPTTCSILVYENDGDFINWHYDVNYFQGRFFTLIVPVTFADNCTEYTYIDKEGANQNIKNKKGTSILFEGDKVFHMATKFCTKGGTRKRVVVSMQFATDSTISLYNRALMRIKDTAYIGF